MSEGYFPHGRSMLRYVQEHRAVGATYGQRALIIGSTHPVATVGTTQSTLHRDRPFERLARTAIFFEKVYFGTREEADKVLRVVHGMHSQVHGELERDEGNFPAGTAYDAFDADLMLWTMAVLAESSRVAFETLVRPLDPAESEALWRDWVLFGELFGMPRSVAPKSAMEFEEWMAQWYAGPDMHANEEAYIVTRAIATAVPVPLPMKVGIVGTNMIVRGMLPAPVRRLFDLRWSPAHEAAFRAATQGIRRSQRMLPTPIRKGDNLDMHRLVIATERDRVSRGKPTIDLPAA